VGVSLGVPSQKLRLASGSSLPTGQAGFPLQSFTRMPLRSVSPQLQMKISTVPSSITRNPKNQNTYCRAFATRVIFLPSACTHSSKLTSTSCKHAMTIRRSSFQSMLRSPYLANKLPFSSEINLPKVIEWNFIWSSPLSRKPSWYIVLRNFSFASRKQMPKYSLSSFFLMTICSRYIFPLASMIALNFRSPPRKSPRSRVPTSVAVCGDSHATLPKKTLDSFLISRAACLCWCSSPTCQSAFLFSTNHLRHFYQSFPPPHPPTSPNKTQEQYEK